MRTIETILSPTLFGRIKIPGEKIVVIIDILRASSTMCTIIHNGARSVIPVEDELIAGEYRNKGYLVGGERNGQIIPGFDFGNSPFDYSSEIVKGKDVVLTTTNGTRCITIASSAYQVIIGSFLNLNTVCNYLKQADKDVVLFCAGWKNRVNLEDSLFAGALCAELEGKFLEDDASILCRLAFKSTAESSMKDVLKSSNHFRRLSGLGLEADIEFCCKMNEFNVLPVCKDGVLINALSSEH